MTDDTQVPCMNIIQAKLHRCTETISTSVDYLMQLEHDLWIFECQKIRFHSPVLFRVSSRPRHHKGKVVTCNFLCDFSKLGL